MAEIGVLENGRFTLSDGIEKLIVGAGFALNPKKTRLSHRLSRQEVTGLTVNSHPNVSSRFSRDTRAMCNELLWGRAPFKHAFWSNEKLPVSLEQLEGRLSFEDFVRDPRRRRLISEKIDKPTKFESLYRDFLLYRYLLRSNGPVFFAEGESDRIYVDLALKRLRLGSRTFFIEDNGKEVRRYEMPGDRSTFHELTSLGGGTSNLHHGLILISQFFRKFKYPQTRWPAIVLVDSDVAGFNFAKQAGSWFGAEFDNDSHSEIFPLRLGLYIVFVPIPVGRKTAAIEHLIPKSLRDIELGGKKFSMDNKFDASKFFGKVVLAKYIRNDVGIDLKFFDRLVVRLEDTIALYEADSGVD